MKNNSETHSKAHMDLPENIQNLIDDFAFLDDWEERYMHVIDMGKALPGLPEGAKTEANKVKGCVSQVWLVTERQDNRFIFSGDSDAHIVRGLVAIVLEIYSGRTAAEIEQLNPQDILATLELDEHLSPQRSNGLKAMIGRIERIAATA